MPSQRYMTTRQTLLHTTSDDETLAHQARDDPEAFGELYRRHVLRVYRYHFARTGGVHDAEDLTAQTFLSALEGIAGYRGSGGFLAWLMGIARRKLAMSYRNRKSNVFYDAIAELPDSAPSPEAVASKRLQLEQISRALAGITPDRAEAVLLCIFADLSAAEAGCVMDKSPAAVKMSLMRGLRDLKKELVSDERSPI